MSVVTISMQDTSCKIISVAVSLVFLAIIVSNTEVNFNRVPEVNFNLVPRLFITQAYEQPGYKATVSSAWLQPG